MAPSVPPLLLAWLAQSGPPRLTHAHALQALVKVLVSAFLLVGGTVGLLIVLLLYVLDLRHEGWTWHYVALLGAMLASTDAVAIVATMKSGAEALALQPARFTESRTLLHASSAAMCGEHASASTGSDTSTGEREACPGTKQQLHHTFQRCSYRNPL